MNKSYEVKTGTQKNTTCRVIVIGGSLAGLFAARVLADFFEKVTILDRDIFPVRPDHRKGVPQSYHAHALLPTAFPILERLFPGIMNDLCKDGAATASNIVPLAIVSPKGLLPLPKWAEIIAFSRYLLEWHVRYRVSRLPEPLCEYRQGTINYHDPWLPRLLVYLAQSDGRTRPSLSG